MIGNDRDGLRAQVLGADEQDAHPVDVARWVRLAEQVLDAEGVRGDAELSVLFMSEASIAELNEKFMGEDRPTDVLAFPIDDDPMQRGRFPDNGPAGPSRDREFPDDLPVLLGDVVICPAVAARQAPEHGQSLEDELALLVVHGILHVLGHDHADEEETKAMQAKEQDLLARFHKP